LWGLLAPPNDYRKRKKLLDWMYRHEDKVEKARKKLDNSQTKIGRYSPPPNSDIFIVLITASHCIDGFS